MSDFLVNLARRSAGLAPLIRARTPVPSPITDVPSEATGETAMPEVRPTASAVSAGAAPPTLAAAALPPTVVIAAPPPTPSTTPTTVVQRVPVAAPSAPAQWGGTLPRVADTAPTAAPSRPPRIERTAPQRIIVPVAQTAAPAAPSLPARIEARAPVTPPSVAIPAPPQREPAQVESTREIVRDETRIVERVIEPREGSARERMTVRIEPTPTEPPVALPTWSRVEPVPALESTIQVRIGTIEIHGAEAAPVVIPASPLTSMTPNTQPVVGFDAFAQLRSYAPWQW